MPLEGHKYFFTPAIMGSSKPTQDQTDKDDTWPTKHSAPIANCSNLYTSIHTE